MATTSQPPNPDVDARSTRAGTENARDTGRPAADEGPRAERTRTSTAWAAVAAGLAVALLMLIFILQNGHTTRLELLWADFSLPVGVTVLLAMVIGGLVVVAVGAGRVLQLRLAARRHRGMHRR